jgi:hypothetical protein
MGDWLDTLFGAAGDIGADIAAFLQYLIALLVALFQFLYSLLAAIFNFLYSILQKVVQFFEDIWNNFLSGIFSDIWSAIVKVHDWLENLLQPIIDFLNKIKEWVNWVYTTYVRPFLNILNQVRSFLNLLRQFGIKWAAELDSWLGKISSDIQGAFNKLNGYLNAIIGIVNSLADPLGLFRGPTLLMSMRRIFPGLARGVSGLPLGYFFPSPLKNAFSGTGPVSYPFNPSDPSQNPPVSNYFNDDDGLGDFDGWDGTDPIDNDDADDVQALDFFNDDNWPDPVNDDPSDAANDAWSAQFSLSFFTS